MVDYVLIGERIREIRTRQNISQMQLAERAELSTPYMSHIEKGKKRVSLPALVSIAGALGVTVNDLLSGNQPFDPAEYHSDMELLLSDCSSREKKILYETAAAVKQILRKND